MNTRKTDKEPYPIETVGSRMSTNVPVYKADDSFEKVADELFEKRWDSVRAVYVVDSEQKLIGIVDVAQAETTPKKISLKDIMHPAKYILHPKADQEKAVFMAIHNDLAAIPVIDSHGVFVGAVTGHSLIDIMHEEHIEDTMLTAGLRESKTSFIKLASERTGLIVRSRAPWLIFGLIIGMGLGLIASIFEETLEASIAIAFFIPVIAYIADSVGTQSSTITVRALALMKLDYKRYLVKELLIGMTLGVILGALGALGALLISQEVLVALVVGLSLFSASTISCVLASAMPMALKALGKDPAPGSGPLATALQDIISLLIYFLIAVAILG